MARILVRHRPNAHRPCWRAAERLSSRCVAMTPHQSVEVPRATNRLSHPTANMPQQMV